MLKWLGILIGTLRSVFESRRDLALENLVLCQQVAVLEQACPRPKLSDGDRFFWLLVSRFWSGWRDVMIGMHILALALLVPGMEIVQAQQNPPAARITLAEAKTAVDAAEAEARANGWNLAFVITDAEGTPILVRRMDGVPTRNYEVAMNKTNTAITSGMHTADYAAAVQAGEIEAIEGALTFDGGLLLQRGGDVLGAFSASGARGAEDAQAVRAGMAAIGIQP